jgi:hypothetical protein
MPKSCPDFLCHYYECERGPLLSLTDLSTEDGELLLENIRQKGDVFASRRGPDYLSVRRGLEARLRELFVQKGGQPRRVRPHYFILGESAWCEGWYRQAACLRVKLCELDSQAVSFTYGDSFPAMRFQDGRPYRGIVYTLAELPGLVDQYGLPHEWNPEGKLGPERYIEAQVWQEVAIPTSG